MTETDETVLVRREGAVDTSELTSPPAEAPTLEGLTKALQSAAFDALFEANQLRESEITQSSLIEHLKEKFPEFDEVDAHMIETAPQQWEAAIQAATIGLESIRSVAQSIGGQLSITSVQKSISLMNVCLTENQAGIIRRLSPNAPTPAELFQARLDEMKPLEAFDQPGPVAGRISEVLKIREIEEAAKAKRLAEAKALMIGLATELRDQLPQDLRTDLGIDEKPPTISRNSSSYVEVEPSASARTQEHDRRLGGALEALKDQPPFNRLTDVTFHVKNGSFTFRCQEFDDMGINDK